MSDIIYTSGLTKNTNGADSVFIHLRNGVYTINAASRTIDMTRAQVESLAEFVLDVMEDKIDGLIRDCSTQMMDTIYRPDYTSAIYSKLTFQKTLGYDAISIRFQLFGSALLGSVCFHIHLDMEAASWLASHVVQTREVAQAA